MYRLLRILDDEGPIGRTSLSFKSRLNYSACIKYISFFEDLGWVSVTRDENNPQVIITGSGKQHCFFIARHLGEPLGARLFPDEVLLATHLS